MDINLSNFSTNNTVILIIDDKERVRESLALSLKSRGYRPITSDTIEDSWKTIMSEHIDLALIDIQLGDKNGLDLLKQIQNMERPIPVILFTGFGTIESAIEAIKLGAFNYLQKPIKIEQLVASINSALRIQYLEEENMKLQNQIQEDKYFISFGQMTQKMHQRAKKLAKTELPVLIQGESGTGKEMLAEFIHQSSERKHFPLIKVNCAALPESLIDDELFGHEKGAYTGANVSFKGVFERADKGTLFLDELGDMPMSTQAKILRAIQNHEVKKIGSDKILNVNVRFITATNKNLENLIKEGDFREDLYYRLSTAVINIPPLREQKDEIMLLASHFLSSIRNPSHSAMTLSPETAELFIRYRWPGNIRELKSTIQYSAAITESSVIDIEDLPRKLLETMHPVSKGNLRQNMEIELIIRTLKDYDNNKSKAAEMMGISRATLYNKLKEFGI